MDAAVVSSGQLEERRIYRRPHTGQSEVKGLDQLEGEQHCSAQGTAAWP